MKKCKNCQLIKNLSDFYVNNHRNGRTYTNSECKICHNKRFLAYTRKYRSLNREKVRAWGKKHKQRVYADPVKHEKAKRQRRESFRRTYLHVLWKRTQKRAFLKSLEFNIVEKELSIPSVCPILNIPLLIGSKGKYMSSPTIDRIDNSKGYTKDNICIISMLANIMKSCASKEQLLLFCKNIPNYINGNDIVQPIEK